MSSPFSLLAFLILHFAALLVIVLAAWGLGGLLLRRWDFAGGAESAVLAWGAGMALVAYAVFLLGLTGALYRPALVGVLAVGLVGAAVRGREMLGRVRPRAAGSRRWPALLALAAAAALALPVALQPLYPPVDSDATGYHLAVAKLYLEQHRLVVATYLRYPVFPQLQEMLFTLAMGVFDDVTAHLVSFAQWGTTAVALYALGKRTADKATGWLAAALWLGGPTGLILGSNGYVDSGLVCFVTLGVLALAVFRTTGRLRWALLSGVFVGCAAATKYSGLFFVPALAVALAVLAPHGIRGRGVLVCLGGAALAAVPWYVRNAVLTGDPLFPFLGGFFGSRIWNAEDLFYQMRELRSHGAGRTALDFVLLWGRLGFQQGMFVGPEDVFSPALWIPLPVLLIVAWKRPVERTLLVLALAYVVVWFFQAQQGRYLLPIVPILCLAMGGALARAASAVARLVRVPARAVACVGALLLALPAAWYARDRTSIRGLPPSTPGAREAFIERRYPTYPAYAWLNRRHGHGYRIYAWRDGTMAYFADGAFMGDCFGPARNSALERALPDGEKVYEVLRALDADYLLVPNGLGPVVIPDDKPFRRHFELVYPGPGARVYAIDGGSTSAARRRAGSASAD